MRTSEDPQTRNWIETYGGVGASFLMGKVVGVRPGKPGLQVGTMVRQMILAGIVVLLPMGVQAQRRGMTMSASRGATLAPRAMAPAPQAGRVMPGTRMPVRPVRGGTPRSRVGMAVGRSTRGVSTPRRFDNFGNNEFGHRRNCTSAPGLGFDEAHQVATCGPGQRGFQGSAFAYPFYFPFYDGGFYVPDAPAGVDDSRVAYAEQPDSTEGADDPYSGRRYRSAETGPAPAALTASPEQTENDEFVFVRRDGSVFFAVAYSWEKGALHYVTDQGLRHSVTEDALDLDATKQFNEQRGLSF